MNIPQSLTNLAKILSPLAPLYVVGGAVRDFLLGRDYTDIDICSSATPDQVMGLLYSTRYICHDINKHLGKLLITIDGDRYEYTTFRTESYAEKGDHTPSVTSFTSDIAVDCLRRDFTVNALYYDILSERVVDLVGGVDDLRAQVIRTAHSPEITFHDDGLRLLRMVRFALELDFDIDSATIDSARQNAQNLRAISHERIRAELTKIFANNLQNAIKSAKIMQKCHFFDYIFSFLPKKINFEYLSRAKNTNRFLAFCVDIFYASGLDIDEYIAHISRDLCLTKDEKSHLKMLLRGLDEISRFDEKFMLQYYIIREELCDLCSPDISVAIRSAYADKISQKAPFAISDLDISASDLIVLGVARTAVSATLHDLLLDAFAHPEHNDKNYLIAHIKEKI